MARARPKPPLDDNLYDAPEADDYAVYDDYSRDHAGHSRVTFAIATSPDQPPMRLHINWLTLTLFGAVIAVVFFLAGLEIYSLVAGPANTNGSETAVQSNTSLAREQQLQRLIDAEEDRLSKLQDENKKRRQDLTDLEGRINSLADILGDLKRQADIIDGKLGITSPAAAPPAAATTAPTVPPTTVSPTLQAPQTPAPSQPPTPSGKGKPSTQNTSNSAASNNVEAASLIVGTVTVSSTAKSKTSPTMRTAQTATVSGTSGGEQDRIEALTYSQQLSRVETELRNINLSLTGNRESLDSLNAELARFADELDKQRSTLEDRVTEQQLQLIATQPKTPKPGVTVITGKGSNPNANGNVSITLDPNAPDIMPVNGPISQLFGCTDVSLEPLNASCRGGHFHMGLDIAVGTGTQVRATKAGKVYYAQYDNSYGYNVRLDHGYGFTTLYGHNSKLLVTVGQLVNKGDIIALSGSTGASTGPHVHYQIELKGVAVDPFRFITNRPPVDTSIK